MSWHFSQALVAAYSAENSSGGKPCAPSSGMATPATYCSHGKTTVPSKPSRYGMTCKPLTDTHGEAVLTWFREAFLAKTFQPLEKAQELTESEAGCGDTWRESLARFDRDSSSWKTPQCSLLAGLDEFSETWPRWGMMRDGECWAQSMPAHLIAEIEYGLSETWPTPRSCSAMASKISLESAWSDNQFPNLETVVGRRMWPTPDTCAGGTGPSQAKRNQPRLQDAVKLWATPNARDWKEQTLSLALARAHDNAEKSRQLPRQMSAECPELHGGKLNPRWVEWLMGWPLGWTDCAASATDKFQQWRHSHGAY